MIEFDKNKYKALALAKYGNYEKYASILSDTYGLEKKKDAVTKWGQKANSNVPTAKDLPIVAKSLGVEIIDLYTDSDSVRKKIANEENKKISTTTTTKIGEGKPTYIQSFDNKNSKLINVECHTNMKVSAGLGNGGIVETKPNIVKYPEKFLKEYFGIKNFENLHMVQVNGHSMEPILKDGEYIFLERGQKPINGETVIARYGNELFVKIFKKIDPRSGKYALRSYNSAYQDIIVDVEHGQEDFEILGVVRCSQKFF